MRKIRGMVLAAGLGQRLRPLTLLLAKPAVPFLGRPLIHYSLDQLGSLGIRELAVNLHYLPETVEEALRGRTEHILLSREDPILGTAGCLGRLREFFSDGTIVLSNGKIYLADVSLEGALREHLDRKSMVTMVLVPFREGMPFKKVYLDRDRNILGFSRNMTSADELARIEARHGTRAFVYTGIQILDSEVLSFIPGGYSDTVADIYPKLIESGFPLRGFVSGGTWRECSTPERYLHASLEVMEINRQAATGTGASPGAGIFAGDSVKIPPDARLRNCVIWDNSRIGSGSCFENVIIAGTSGVLPDEMEVRDAVITPRLDHIPVPLAAGALPGPDYIIWPLEKPAGQLP